MRKTVATLLVVLALPGPSQAQFILAADSGGDRIVKLDAFDGSIVDPDFITDAGDPNTYDLNLPKGIAVANNQIWVSDQNADAVFRFDLNGNYVGKTTGLDNVRGLNQVGNEVWVTSDGSAASGTADTVFRIGYDGTINSTFTVTGGSGFDVVQRGNEVLIAEIDTDDINRYDLNGNFLGTFVDSDGIASFDFPQQMLSEGGDLFVAGFSFPTGIFRFDSNGNQTGSWNISGDLGMRGITRLGNGQLLVTGGTRLLSLDTTTGIETEISNVLGDSWQYLTPVPEPAILALLTLGAAALMRRRKS